MYAYELTLFSRRIQIYVTSGWYANSSPSYHFLSSLALHSWLARTWLWAILLHAIDCHYDSSSSLRVFAYLSFVWSSCQISLLDSPSWSCESHSKPARIGRDSVCFVWVPSMNWLKNEKRIELWLWMTIFTKTVFTPFHFIFIVVTC